MGRELSIDETALSKGELYTIVTSKKAKGQKGSIVAIIAGTKVETVVHHLKKIPHSKRRKVTEITLDMAPTMKQIVSQCFPAATQVTDRFHVQRLALEALQDIRIKHRWKALDQENEMIKQSRKQGKAYQPRTYNNGDTSKQLLARSRYLLYKDPSNWTENQQQRAVILFKEYPDLKQAFNLVQSLRNIFNQCTEIQAAYTRLAQWYNNVERSGFKSFNTIMNTIKLNYISILNYFINRSTNAAAESFNAKIKAFRAQFRGVKNTEFFLFRLCKIYA